MKRQFNEWKQHVRGIYRTCAMIVAVMAVSAGGVEFAGGRGEPNDPYQIATAEQLVAMGSDPNAMTKHFLLVADIDLDPNLPGRRVFDRAVVAAYAGANASPDDPLAFDGRFDGGGHVVRHLTIRCQTTCPVGLFGDVGRRGKVERLALERADVCGAVAVGILAGNNAGTIEACYTTGVARCMRLSPERKKTAVEYDEYDKEMLEQLKKIYGAKYIEEMYANAKKNLADANRPARIGGLVGVNHRTIESCYSEASVDGTCEDARPVDAGGLAGANSGCIAASYFCGLVTGQAGGFVGRNTVGENSGEVYLCYWDTRRSRATNNDAGTGVSTARMMQAETFRGWDYGGHWTIRDTKDYPRLWWERRAGLPIPGLQAYLRGSGLADDPFTIRSAEELALVGRFRTSWDKCFVLAHDIDMSAVDANEVLPIGSRNLPFTGHFDGHGHVVDNFTCHTARTASGTGLFGVVGKREADRVSTEGEIENLGMSHVAVSGLRRVGGLAGENNGTIRLCRVDGRVVGTDDSIGSLVGMNFGRLVGCESACEVSGGERIGGLVGFNWSTGMVEECRSRCRVSGRDGVGGLVGYGSGSIRCCCATGAVTGEHDVGGLIGTSNARVHGCYATADVSGSKSVGGLIGDNGISVVACYATGCVSGATGIGGLVGDNSGGIVACYATGQVAGEKSVGGLIGSQHLFMISSVKVGTDLLCYWDVETSGVATSDGGTGESTRELMQAGTFTGWDIDGIWILNEGKEYPRLAWQRLPGKTIESDPNRYGGGSGTEDNPFQIRTVDHLRALATHPGDFDDHFVLANDLDLTNVDSQGYLPIGVEGIPFVGTFDGQNHTISNLTIRRPGEQQVGLFGQAGPVSLELAASPMRIENLHIANAHVEGESCIGGIVGTLGKGTLWRCSMTGRVEGDAGAGGLVGTSCGEIIECTVDVEVRADGHAGALVGHNQGMIRFCAGRGRITGKSRIGGLVGLNMGDIASHKPLRSDRFRATAGCIMESLADCVVSGSEDIGGLVGYLAEGGRIESCHARGQVRGGRDVGGLVGSFGQAIISNSYSAAAVSGAENVGGFLGVNPDYALHKHHPTHIAGIINACFWDSTAATVDVGTGDHSESVGFVGLPTAYMKTAEPFIEAGWDFDQVWVIAEGADYPRLRWELEAYGR